MSTHFRTNLADFNHRQALQVLRRSVLLVCVMAAILGANISAFAGFLPLNGSVSGKAVSMSASSTDPNLFSDYASGSGTSSIGKVTIVAHHFERADTGLITDGVLVFKTSAGLIFGTYVGNAVPTSDPFAYVIVGTMIFSGGTGHYNNATGRASFQGPLNIVQITASGVLLEDFTLNFGGALNVR